MLLGSRGETHLVVLAIVVTSPHLIIGLLTMCLLTIARDKRGAHRSADNR